MRLFTSLIATTAILFSASTALAAATWTVTATASDGAPLSALNAGTTLTLDIGLTTDVAELVAISGSVNNYDNSILTPNAAASTISGSVMCEFFNAMFGGCINGLTNLESGLRTQVGVEGAGAEDTFLSLLGTTPATGTGAADEPFPQFSIVYNVDAAGSTTLRVGTFGDYADAYALLSGPGVVNNTSVAITVPEPTSVAASLAGLGSVLGVVAIRRRND